jgi:pimeloyl-ACP methyl ester carboxylesterase
VVHRRVVVVAGAVGVAGVAGVVASAHVVAARLRRLPDRVPPADLLAEPPGADSVVERPDGTRLRVRVAGDGPTVVLAHGLALALGEWSLVSPLLLADGYRVVAFDARGHGRSTIGSQGVNARVMAEDLAAVLEATGTTDTVLVGHSMGGFLALAAVLDVAGVADRLAGLVLVASFAGDILDRAPQNRAEAPLLRSHLLAHLAANPTVGTLFAASFFGPRPCPTMLAAFLTMVLAGDHQPLLPLLDAFTSRDLLDRLPAVQVPTVVVCGLADRTAPPWDSERMAAAIPGARAIWVEGVGHMIPWESPTTIRDAVAQASPVQATAACSGAAGARRRRGEGVIDEVPLRVSR